MYTVTNIDNVVKSFDNDADFIGYVKAIFKENEGDNEAGLLEPQTVEECRDYLTSYCQNLTLSIG